MKANTNAKPSEPTKLCFSYLRYSSAKQHGNTSEERQQEIAPRVAAEKGWTLEPTYNAKDLGVSGWSGSNVKTIESIITNAHNGLIPVGTVCIIEKLDRYSRLPVDEAYQLLRKMLLAGIEIYEESSSRHLTKADLNNAMSIMLTVAALDSAFQFSDKLSERVGKAWQKKRERLMNGEKLTAMVPSWINAKTWEPIPARVATVKEMFTMYLDGFGISAIVKKFNQNRTPTWSKNGKKTQWSSSQVSTVLKSRATIGEFQAFKCVKSENGRYYNRIPNGEVIKGYFPAIIKPDIFYSLQDKLGNRTHVRKTDALRNLFSGVAYCKCGSKMYLAGGKKLKNGTQSLYYYCRAQLIGSNESKCKQPSMHYGNIEASMAFLFYLDPAALARKTFNIGLEVSRINGRLQDLHTQIANITKATLGGRATKALVAAQAELETEVEQLEQERNIAESRTVAGKTDEADFKFIRSNMDNLATNMELRRRVHDWCLTNLSAITFNAKDDYFDVAIKEGKTFRFDFSTPNLPPLLKDAATGKRIFPATKK